MNTKKITEKVYESTLDKLVKAFENNLTNPKNINAEEIERATQSMIQTIKSFDFGEEYKNALANACIESASLLDSETISNKQDIVEALRKNLDDELAYLLRPSVVPG